LPTLLACIYKQSASDTSCRDVEDWVALRLPANDSANAGDDFCEARKRLPEALFARAFAHLGALAADPASSKVFIVDGTGLTLPRSAANFLAFGTPHGKARLPGARLLLLTDAHSGALAHADLTGCHEGEMRQFLRCLKAVPRGTTIVGDRQFSSYLAFHEMTELGINAVMNLNVSRKPVHIERLSEDDEIHVWQRPKPKSSAFGERIKELPPLMRVRVVHAVVERKGYRTTNIRIATNLLDATRWPPAKIVELYDLRWRIENDIRDLKLRHGLTMLSCKSEDTVRKEVWSALIACNAIRVMQTKSGKCPRSLSHERCRTIILEACSQMAQALTTCLPMLHERLLKRIAQCRLKRQERPPCPRALIRNPIADYPILYRSREQWYAHYLSGPT